VRSTATSVGVAALVVTAVVPLAACGDGGGSSALASRTASVTASLAASERATSTRAERTAEPTGEDRTTAPEPTREERTTAPEPTGERTVERTVQQTVEQTVERTVEQTVGRTVVHTIATAAPTANAAATPGAEPAADTGEVESWVWWALLFAVIGLAAGVWFLQVRSRRQEWVRGVDAAVGEIAWLSRTVVPDLARAPSPQQRMLVWASASGRAGALADSLAGLAGTAPDPEAAGRVQLVGDAVGQARTHLDQLVTAEDETGLTDRLWSVSRELDAAVAAMQQPPVPA
jgi:hypothetical protein